MMGTSNKTGSMWLEAWGRRSLHLLLLDAILEDDEVRRHTVLAVVHEDNVAVHLQRPVDVSGASQGVCGRCGVCGAHVR